MKIELPDTKSTVSLIGLRLSVILVLFAFICIGPAVAAVDSANRSVNKTEVAPGDTVAVTTSAEFEPSTSDASIEEMIFPALPAENIAITDDDGATISAYQESSGTVLASWGNVSSVTLQYEITVPTDTPAGTTFNFSGGEAVDSADDDTAAITGDQMITVLENHANEANTSTTDTSESAGDTTNKTDESGDDTTDGTTDTSESAGDTTNKTDESGDDTTDGVPGFGIAVAVSALTLWTLSVKRVSQQ